MNTLQKAADEARKRVIEQTLVVENWNQSAAAKKLGVHRNTMRTLINKFGIEVRGGKIKHGRARRGLPGLGMVR